MATAPVKSLTKSEIVWLHTHRCKHGHRYLAHYNCYLAEVKHKEIIGFLDIETTHLDANFGVILSWCIKIGKKIHSDCITKKDLADPKILDKKVVQSCVATMMQCNKIVTHYGSRFDIPYIRTRALSHRVYFPTYGELQQEDTWAMAKNSLKLSSNRQDAVAEILNGHSIKTRFNRKYWMLAMMGDEKSIEYIFEHNKKDVIELEKNYYRLQPYVRKTNRSI